MARMQTLSWYYWRLKSMSAGEIAWRLQGVAAGFVDKARFALNHWPAEARTAAKLTGAKPPFRVCDLAPGELAARGTAQEKQWLERLLRQADEIAAHRLSFFDLKSRHLGDPIDWHRDHSANVASPRGFSPSIDYRDFNVAGDCKLVWEPSRHHHLVILARAYRASGERRYAEAVAEQLDSWLKDNPFPTGMNWRSGLELGVRLVNWVWALDLIRESGVISGELEERILEAVYLHCWENARKYSQASSANNHLVGEAAGVYVACAYFDQMPNAQRWRDQAREIVERELQLQSHADGCTREQAIGYQMFVLEFYVACGLAGRWRKEEFPAAYWQRVEKMMEFLGLLREGGDCLPFFGDYDDGYVLDLGREARDPRDLLALGAVLFGRKDFKTWAGGLREPVRWHLGAAGAEAFARLPAMPTRNLPSLAFTDSGHYLLQSGPAGSTDAISVHFDCAELGFGAIAAHGHADALGFALRAFGTDVIVDPGTYDYYTYRPWRDYFRTTRAHNTVEIDGLDQSTMLGNFMWGQRANAKCLAWKPDEQGGSIHGEHDGYRRLASAVTHRRTLTLSGSERQVVIDDEIDTAGAHDVALYFQLSEHCQPALTGSNECTIDVAGRRVVLRVEEGMTLQLLKASAEPIQAWVSRGYHHKAPSHTLVARARVSATRRFKTVISL
jgi:Heparinase II/III-like protein/Heparinase II/III N-terminus